MTLLDRINALRGWRDESVYLYNLDNNRPDDIVERELLAFAETRAAAILLVETIGNRLPQLAEYRLHRDRSNDSRENISAYVRKDLAGKDRDWLDLKGTWPRPHGGGTHPPRSFLIVRVGRIKVYVAHQAPRNAKGWRLLQLEGTTRLAKEMNRGGVIARVRPQILGWDANATVSDDGDGPATLAREIGGKVHNGNRIDNFVTRNVRVRRAEVVTTVRGVRLASDHKHAVRLDFAVRPFWLTRRK